MAVSVTLQNAVLAKLTYGPTKSSRAELNKLGLDKWLDDQLNPNKAEDKFTKGVLGQFRAQNLSQYDIEHTLPYSVNSSKVSDELALTTIYRRFASSRQVYETLVEFLQDLVPTPLYNDQVKRLSYDRDAIRANALGNYTDLLYATALHPEMLTFLNGYSNERNHPNENYGRELLELFTVTTATSYTQDDVVNAARVFSGISFDNVNMQNFADPNRHWQGQVKVLGWSDPNPGKTPDQIFNTARGLVKYLTQLPETARAFSLRMAKRYVSDTPSSSIVTAMTTTYLASGANIPEVVKTMAKHPGFMASAGAKLKRPTEHLISTMRALEMNINGSINAGNTSNFDDYWRGSLLNTVWWLTMKGGHDPFNWPFPNGFPDTESAWTNMAGQVVRWNNAVNLIMGYDGFDQPDLRVLFGAPANTVATIVDAAATKILGRKLTSASRANVIAGVSLIKSTNTKALYGQRLQAAALLVFATEEWNRR